MFVCRRTPAFGGREAVGVVSSLVLRPRRSSEAFTQPALAEVILSAQNFACSIQLHSSLEALKPLASLWPQDQAPPHDTIARNQRLASCLFSRNVEHLQSDTFSLWAASLAHRQPSGVALLTWSADPRTGIFDEILMMGRLLAKIPRSTKGAGLDPEANAHRKLSRKNRCGQGLQVLQCPSHSLTLSPRSPDRSENTMSVL